MTAPALRSGVLGKSVLPDARELVLVQVHGREAIYMIAVIKKKTRAVGVAEIIEASDRHSAAILAAIQVVDELIGRIKPEKVDFQRGSLRFDFLEHLVLFFLSAGLVAGAENHPCDAISSLGGRLQFFNLELCGDNKVAPRLIVRVALAALKIPQRRTAGNNDRFAGDGIGRSDADRQCPKAQDQSQAQTKAAAEIQFFHGVESLYASRTKARQC